MKKQTNSDKMDESLSMRRGKESTKKQSYTNRRHESEGSKKKSIKSKTALHAPRGHKGK
jgi:hypothetical protein